MKNTSEAHFYGMLNFDCIGDNDVQIRITCKELCIQLRKLEYTGIISHETFSEAIRHIRLCYFLIYRENFYESIKIYNYLLEELNERYIHYYNFMNANFTNDFKSIRVAIVYKHHQAVKYIKNYFDKDKCLPSMLSFDSHADINPMNINDDGSFRDDIGCVHVPIFSHFKNNSGLLWIVPNWVKIRVERTKINIGILDNAYTFNNNSNVVSSLYYNVSNIEDMYENTNAISENYILNIDLDYFVTNGDKICSENSISSQFDSLDDTMSDQRCVIDFEHIKDCVYSNECMENLSKEISCIRERIKLFTNFLIYLKNKNKRPSFIVFCNSTNVKFSIGECTLPQNNNSNSNCTNSFIPSYLSFWLLNTVYNEVNIIFDKNSQ